MKALFGIGCLALIAMSAAGARQAPPGDAAGKAGKVTIVSPPAVEMIVPVAVGVKTDKKTYTANDPIVMTITVKNATRRPVKLPFATGQRYDIEIRRGTARTGEKVWQWSRNRMFNMMVMTQVLQPGKSLMFTETFKPSQEQAPVLSRGTYTITATLTTSGRTPRPFGSTVITVR